MRRIIYILFFVSIFIRTETNAQSKYYIVKPASFSSRIFDEFSPVIYRDGIVFCSNQNDNSPVSFNDEHNRLFKIFYVRKKGTSGWNNPKILSTEITTTFNDGPATFDKGGNIMFFSRNNFIENSLKSISDTSNKLGIYSAELKDGIWTNIKPFSYNNLHYSLTTPSLAPEGERIYFASDMPGGSGGMDLYYCTRRNNDWDPPVNLGPVVNTSENESFPFACSFGKLFFASDGHKGSGGKDLYYTQEINGTWIAPVHLDSAINSPYDDFGIVIDSSFGSGYFSTNRRNTDDIFSFSSAPEEFTACDSIKKNNYCFTFYDEKHNLIDTIAATYLWDFGEGAIRSGSEIRHCFPGPGHYIVKLNIVDEITGDTIAKQVDYKVDLENISQALIDSPDTGFTDKSVSFTGVITDLKGISITDLFWDFGEGFNPGGTTMNHTFRKKGEYTVRLGLLEEKDTQGVINKMCVMKKIKIN
jgi:hypothetical protein